MAKKMRIPGVSFSWKRAIGVTSAKRRLAKATGIPTTRSGRQRKAGKMMGCAIPFTPAILIPVLSLITFILS